MPLYNSILRFSSVLACTAGVLLYNAFCAASSSVNTYGAWLLFWAVACGFWAVLGYLSVTLKYLHHHIYPIERRIDMVKIYDCQVPIVPPSLPWSDRLIFAFCRNPVYLWHFVKAVLQILSGYGPEKAPVITDSELGSLAARTSFCEGLSLMEACPVVLQHGSINGEQITHYQFMDYPIFDSYDGVFTEQCTIILKRIEGKVDHLFPVCIRIRDEAFEPKDGLQWEMAKLFLGSRICDFMTITNHVTIHILSDLVYHSMRATLYAGHPLFELLDPHFNISHTLDSTVFWSDTSPFNGRGLSGFYSGYSQTLAGVLKLIAHRTAKYRFECGPTQGPQDLQYSIILSSYYQVLKRFITNVIPAIPRDSYLSCWADGIASYLPGFPAGQALVEDEKRLINVLSTIIFQVSFTHGLQHAWFHKYAGSLVMRVRIPPPSRKYQAPDLSRAAFWLDRWKSFITKEMFYAPTLGPVAENIRQVSYPKLGPSFRPAWEAFQKELSATEAKLRSIYGDFACLDAVTASLWY